ncbi:MAG: hypothetical protein JW850_09700 [Thermoflexales bacterium]|nr:hypothetical protein [Thermoflexales bacterium]
MTRSGHLHDWLSLVSLSGLVVSEPVLASAFPRGPERVDPRLARRFIREWERFRLNKGADPQGRWIDFILHEVLAWEYARVRKGHELPPQTNVTLLEVSQTLRPSRVLVDAQGLPALALTIIPPDRDLDRPETETGRWKASPFTKLDRLLRESGVPLGLLTNGSEWRLVYAAGGLSTASLSWSAQTWADEQPALHGFYTLLGREWVYGLLGLIGQSQDRQVDVADQLGEQVRAAVDVFVHALDESDRASGGELLGGAPLDQLYEMSITLMMRLVFILYAEENNLLPHGQIFYDRSYGLSHLVTRLEAERRADVEAMSRACDAWGQLLAAFRLIHDGCPHPDLSLHAYGGDLFDPQRYRRPDVGAKHALPILEDPRLQVNNLAVYTILRKLTFARTRLGTVTLPQRVSYRSLDIEQIGYVYQGLLDRQLARAGSDPLLKLKGASEAIASLAELEAMPPGRRAAFLARLAGRDEAAIASELGINDPSTSSGAVGAVAAEPVDAEPVEAAASSGGAISWPEADELREDFEPALAERAVPYARVITSGGVIAPGQLYLTTGQSRRATGTHYTPQSLTAPIVEATLGPLVYERFEPAPSPVPPASDGADSPLLRERGGGEGRATWRGTGLKSPAEILSLKVCDIATGSAAFLVQADRYLAERLMDAWDQIEAQHPGIHITPFGQLSTARPQERLLPADRAERLVLARRLVAERCLYGVDKNPLAVEMGRLSLWLATLAKDKPFTFLNHALKCGDSLVGADVYQFLTWSTSGTGTKAPLLQEILKADLERAAAARRQLQAFTVLDVQDVERKAALNAEAEQALARIRLGCDLLIGAQLCGMDSRQAGDLLDRYTSGVERETLLAYGPARQALEAAGKVRPFHWPFEFPEVFLPPDADPATPTLLLGAGMDAFLGNPPFVGGRRIRETLGDDYREYLYVGYPGSSGNADYSAFFFLRAFDKLRPNGRLGLLATNTIAQGDTRETGLDKIIRDGGAIYAATSSMPWPGAAAVHVSVVHVAKGKYDGAKVLNGQKTDAITSYLDRQTRLGNPKRLKQNADKSFQGSVVVGMGFILEPEEAQVLIERDPRNRDVLLPYLNGEDLNSRSDQSPSRWIINFFDWPLEKAETYTEPMAIAREKVYPARAKVSREAHRRHWWHYGDKRPALYKAIASLQQVLVCSRVSKFLSFVFVPLGWVYADTIVVVASKENKNFALVQSGLHELWTRKYASSLETRLRYTPSDVFETFPFPQSLTADQRAALERIGEHYHEHRRQVMLARQEGLTKTYNRFHDPACRDGDIAELRRLHVEMDQAVLAAYGWGDLTLDHDFYGEGKDARYTLSLGVKEELLRRLLLLNFEIAAREEQESKKQGAGGKKAKGKKGGKQGKSAQAGKKGRSKQAPEQARLL